MLAATSSLWAPWFNSGWMSVLAKTDIQPLLNQRPQGGRGRQHLPGGDRDRHRPEARAAASRARCCFWAGRLLLRACSSASRRSRPAERPRCSIQAQYCRRRPFTPGAWRRATPMSTRERQLPLQIHPLLKSALCKPAGARRIHRAPHGKDLATIQRRRLFASTAAPPPPSWC